ncbi:LysR family transcriptional regulator [Stenotrophomonas sp. 24(2023)]|uniref:LysR family transcriptional regulator n=1 Tax=Stenotrophomonas sp. 24(2023) TaxID=3068324 RepID=UPI0027DEEA06|nr:LysR family transcriptional regulator [Stenotrophomonas sp. 24(2023)]WMJ69213.1 LysR family transcriptional regulator [Stenotrophomonas sp. 24(2023)]
MQGLNLDEMRAFVAVVDAGSFVAGGRLLGLTRSAAGKAITRLETHLGVRLLNRTTRTLGLTDDGQVFYQHCTQIFSSLEDAEGSVGQNSGVPRGTLRISLPDALGRSQVLPLLADYRQRWPQVQIEASFSDRVVDLIEEGFDLAVRIGQHAADTSLVSRTVAHHRAVVCAAPAYLQAHGTPKRVDDLLDHECLVFSSRLKRQPWRLQEGKGDWRKVSPHGRLRLDSAEAIRDAALLGLGVACLPAFLVAAHLHDGRLVQVLAGHGTEQVPVQAVYPSRRHLSPKVRCFIDLMVERWAG